jgi:hypothetical protein
MNCSAARAILLTAKASVPHKIRNNLSATAQFIENFKHRKTVVNLMSEALSAPVQPTELHCYLAGLTQLPMIVDMWYDNAMESTLQARDAWGQIQGLSQSEHFGHWTRAYRADGTQADDTEIADWTTVLYKPQGSITPAAHFLVSDTDYVEVITEIHIQTPIPRQIIKRSSAKQWAVLPESPTKNELRFLQEQNIQRIDMSMADFVAALTATQTNDLPRRAASN